MMSLKAVSWQPLEDPYYNVLTITTITFTTNNMGPTFLLSHMSVCIKIVTMVENMNPVRDTTTVSQSRLIVLISD